jgi:hypothetical protein
MISPQNRHRNIYSKHIVIAGKEMARGLSRDLAREKAQKKTVSQKGNKETALTPAQRQERDAKALIEKKLLKETKKEEDIKTGKITEQEIKQEEEKKQRLREKQRMSAFASNNPLLAKTLQQGK